MLSSKSLSSPVTTRLASTALASTNRISCTSTVNFGLLPVVVVVVVAGWVELELELGLELEGWVRIGRSPTGRALATVKTHEPPPKQQIFVRIRFLDR